MVLSSIENIAVTPKKQQKQQYVPPTPESVGKTKRRLDLGPGEQPQPKKLCLGDLGERDERGEPGEIQAETQAETQAASSKPQAETQAEAGEAAPKSSIYSQAKALFQRSCDNSSSAFLPEREREYHALNTFLRQHFTHSVSNSLYISGPPGTGKTAQTQLTLSKYIELAEGSVQSTHIDGKQCNIAYCYINCMTIANNKTIFNEIHKKLTGKKCTSIASSKSELLDLVTTKQFMSVVVLDELDKLINIDQQLLFELFSWCNSAHTNLMLIGISNALDMIDRLLPRLKINGLNPNTLAFLPYNSQQIHNIITAKLSLLAPPGAPDVPLFQKSAIQLCAKKASSNTGDLRKSFDIVRNSIELLERDLLRTHSKQDLLAYHHADAPRVKISHVAKICSSVFDNKQGLVLKNLNIQQKLIVCNLMKLHATQPRELNTNDLFEFYTTNRIDKLIGQLKKCEFLEILTTLESLGIIKLHHAKDGTTKVSSNITSKDLHIAVQDIQLLSNFLSS